MRTAQSTPGGLRAAVGIALAIPALLVAPASSQMDDVVLETTRLEDHLAMIEGRGGNLAVYAGEDGVFLVDDQYAPLSEKIRAEIATLSDQPVRFLLNTHWHGDHTGGNESFGSSGSLIVAHDNVRERLATEQVSEFFDRTTPPSPEAALPVVTFDEEVSFHLDGREIRVFHVPHAHTDGDAVVHFVDDDVIHTGDLFFNGLYPFIDAESGGRIDGVLAGVDRILDLCSEETRIIPGHGPLASVDDLRTYRAMLADLHQKLEDSLARGESFETFMEGDPTAQYEEAWGQAWLSGRQFLEIVHGEMRRR